MKNAGRENVILDMIKGQEQKIANCQARIAVLQAELVDLQRPPVDIQGLCGKILYVSQKAAHAARKLINRDLRKNGKQTLKRAYHCQVCDAWHLTTIPHWLPPEPGGLIPNIND